MQFSEPTNENVPAGHNEQLEDSFVEYVPPGQSSQYACPILENVPGGQG